MNRRRERVRLTANVRLEHLLKRKVGEEKAVPDPLQSCKLSGHGKVFIRPVAPIGYLLLYVDHLITTKTPMK
ncbi:MAG: hypothetical protein HY894_01510 [Deltaproteobacteria bacterium]|nr:hypothetical protein [Deltaproteobacteria bacterium]